ncbi:ATP-binding cassette sub-family F member 3-like [Hydractinia symbiolongicarpus]|uniref:ATP-binding cassette sub-family F member 3-like n=1 Tax=Hydractinia symbiolongicarpus TaxID=13093 RepID=UPI0025510F57|nr:ATP-binding cassette sub-family F member 3-like [Hydractinia symbiolongicarpus]XP_057304555.1 ATP-binding cassette sub-family F member 3-like [Hydractinia symbiolongicarpus]
MSDGVEVLVENFLQKKIPNIDSDLLTYVVDVTKTSVDDFESADDLYDAVGGVLHEAIENDDENEIKNICKGIINLLNKDTTTETTKNVKILNAPVHIGDRTKNDDKTTIHDSIWLKQNNDDITLKTVDLKKLEKADAKLKQKSDKREKDEICNEEEKCAGPTTNQVIQKKDLKQDQSGKVVDIRIENFDLAYGSKVLLKNANLVMAFGRRYGFVGRNGLGKTTLLRAISKRELFIPSHVTVLHVEQEVVGDDTNAVDSVLEADVVRLKLIKEEEELTKRINNSSNPASSTRLSEVYAALSDIEADKAPARVSMILSGLGFTTEMQNMKTKQFSGGWRMRLALARALFTKPDLLLLDEPTNMLDVKAILWLENYLQTWPTTLLVVSHDRMFLDAVATDIVFLHSRSLDTFKGNYTQFEVTKDEKLRNQQREYEAQKQYREHLQAYVDRWRVNANRAAQAQSKLKILEKLPDLTPVEIEPKVTLRLPECDRVNATMLRFDEVDFAYVAGTNIFEKVDLNANMDARIAVLGENGSGKTTLLKILLGEYEPTGGVRRVHRNMRVGYFSQHHVDSLSMKQTSLELFKTRYPGKLDVEYRSHLGKYGVTGELAMRPISSLSGGQKSRVAFAVMTWHEPNFFILDEPTNHLDIETVEALGEALKKFNGGVILVSHNEQLIQMVAQETWLCGNKTVTRIEGGFPAYKKALEEEFRRINT